jgi:hypothetical protein
MNTSRSFVSAVALALALTGLAACGSDPKITVSGTTTVSKGAELADLQAALASAAITQAEYDKLRAIILKRPN